MIVRWFLFSLAGFFSFFDEEVQFSFFLQILFNRLSFLVSRLYHVEILTSEAQMYFELCSILLFFFFFFFFCLTLQLFFFIQFLFVVDLVSVSLRTCRKARERERVRTDFHNTILFNKITVCLEKLKRRTRAITVKLYRAWNSRLLQSSRRHYTL